MGAIDVGSGSADLGDYNDLKNNTMMDIGNAANASGTINSFQVRTSGASDLTNFKVGLFYLSTPATQYTCRSAAAIGTVSGAGLHTYTVSLAVIIGDLLAIYYETGLAINSIITGGVGLYVISGDVITVGLESSFNPTAWITRQASIYATGSFPSRGWCSK